MSIASSTRSLQVGMGIVFAIFLSFIALNASPYQASDTSNFYFQGLLTAKGYLPYRDFDDNKGPLLFYLLSLPAMVTGWSMVGGIVLFRLLDCAVFYSLCRLLKGMNFSASARVVGMAAFTLAYAGAFPFRDETIYSEVPELLCRILGFTAYFVEGSALRAGVFFGVAALFRQTAIVDIPAIAVMHLARIVFGQIPVGKAISCLVGLVVGFLLPLGVLFALSFWQGWFDDFYRHAIEWNLRLAGVVSEGENGQGFVFFLALPFLPLIFLSLNEIVLGLLAQKSKYSPLTPADRRWWPFTLILVFHLYESLISPLFFPHHILPAMMILTILAAESVERLRRVWPLEALKTMGTVFAATVVLIAGVRIMVHLGQFQLLEEETRADRELAHWIADQTTPEQKILVWGYAAQFYLNSQRLPASRFLHNLGITNQSGMFKPIDPRSLKEFQHDLQVNKPAYIVLPAGELSHPDLAQYAPQIEDEYTPVRIELAQKKIFLLKSK